MSDTKFKILVHPKTRTIVDISMLDIGIYATSKPHLYDIETNIDAEIKKAEHLGSFLKGDYLKNLKECDFIEATLVIPENQI